MWSLHQKSFSNSFRFASFSVFENIISHHTNYLVNQSSSRHQVQSNQRVSNLSNSRFLQSHLVRSIVNSSLVVMTSNIDIKSIMNSELEDFYIETIEQFVSDMRVTKDISIDGVIIDEFEFLFRDVRFFVRQLKLVASQHDFSVYWIIHICLQDSTKRWYDRTLRKKQLENSKFNEFCQVLLNRFDKKYESQRQQKQQARVRLIDIRRQKQARIIKEQIDAKARAEAFACRRCSIKYSSNIQLHKHIDEHHIKKIKFETFITSNTASTLSITQDHKTSASSSSSLSKESLIMSFSAMILNQASTSSTSVTFSSQMSVTASITSITSPQITWAAIAAKSVMSIVLFFTSSSSSSQTSILLHQKSYMIIDDLFVMFAEKSFKKNVNIIQKRIVSLVFRQARIISYFKSVSSSKIKTLKFDVFISSFSSTPTEFASINQRSSSPQYQFKYRRCKQIFDFNNQLHSHLTNCRTNEIVKSTRHRDFIDSWRRF